MDQAVVDQSSSNGGSHRNNNNDGRQQRPPHEIGALPATTSVSPFSAATTPPASAITTARTALFGSVSFDEDEKGLFGIGSKIKIKSKKNEIIENMPNTKSKSYHEDEDERYHSPKEEDDHETEAIHGIKALHHPPSSSSYNVNWDLVGHFQQEPEPTPTNISSPLVELTSINNTNNNLPSTNTTGLLLDLDSLPTPSRALERSSSSRRSNNSASTRSRYRYNNNSRSDTHSVNSSEDDFSIVQDFRSETSSEAGSSNSGGAAMRMRRARSRRPTSVPETIQEQQRTRIRQSLDAGMAALRRWIRTRAQHGPETAAAAAAAAAADIVTTSEEQQLSNSTNHQFHMRMFPPRQRSLSEPEGSGMRDFFFERATADPIVSPSSASQNRWASEISAGSSGPFEVNIEEQHQPEPNEPEPEPTAEQDNAEARQRWYQLNRRFQYTIAIVALLFSLLLFTILVCWVVLTSAYVVSIEKPCDIPLKTYFWLATFQLILDVFRTDIMRLLCRWEYTSTQRIPIRVISYNIAYLTYALLVLRLGVKSVYIQESTCHDTATELFQSSKVFVSLTLAAWSLIVFGYLIPFMFVAILLTLNGYTPASDAERRPTVFPAAYSSTGAPPDTINKLRTVLWEEFPSDYPKECCICMTDFVSGDAIVATECSHVFHKRCCQEWLRQARTCPVCRSDIPDSLPVESAASVSVVSQQQTQPAPPQQQQQTPQVGQFPARQDFHQEVVNLLRILREHETRHSERQQQTPPSTEDVEEGRSS